MAKGIPKMKSNPCRRKEGRKRCMTGERARERERPERLVGWLVGGGVGQTMARRLMLLVLLLLLFIGRWWQQRPHALAV